MNTLPATQHPLSTFENVNGDSDIPTPAEFHSYLRTLLSDPALVEGSSTRILPEAHEKWVTLFTGLADSFLSFPLPGDLAWSAWREKVELIESSLEVIRKASTRISGIFVGSNILNKILARLLDLCSVFDIWTTQEIPDNDGLYTALFMKDKAFEVLVGILRSLGDSGATGDSSVWHMSRSFLSECLDLIHELVSHSPPLTPVVILFFNKPRFRGVTPADVDKPNPSDIIISTSSQLDAFAVLVLEVAIQALCYPMLSQWFLTDLIRKASETARLVFEYCLSPMCSAPLRRRITLLTRIIVGGALLSKLHAEFAGPLINLPFRLLRFRLDEIPTSDLETTDAVLHETFQSHMITPFPRASINAALKVLRTSSLGGSDKRLRGFVISYIRGCIPSADQETIQAIRDAISTFNPSFDTGAIGVELEKRQQDIQHISGRAASNGFENISTTEWRKSVHEVTQEIIAPDEDMEIEEDSAGQQFVQQTIRKIKGRFDRPLHKTDALSRVSLAEQLSKLVGLISWQSKHWDIPDTSQVVIISLGLSIVTRLLDGPSEEVTSDVRRHVFAALSQVIKNHTPTASRDGVDHSANIILRGISDIDRSVRLSAGRALVSLVHMYGANGEQLEPLFDHFYHHLDVEKLPMKETLLVSVGLMGKTVNADLLGQVLCFLIAQLGKQNLVIKSSAYTQILALTKYHNKSAYSLLHPYLDRIAPLLVSRMSTQPGLLNECCLLMAISPVDFIERTLPSTLPLLYGNCELKVLQKVAKDLQMQSSKLFLSHSSKILAYIFRLQGPGQTNKALAFIVKTLIDETGNSTIDAKNVVLSCVVFLLAELVVGMGDDGPKADIAVAALKKVERCLAPTANRSKTPTPPNLGALLKTYMLGVMTYITDMLQEVQGKKTVAAKRTILRSLGAFVSHIGPSISNIAPQIMATFQTNISIPELSEATLESWHTFLATLGPEEIGPHVGPTTAVFVSSWAAFPTSTRQLAVHSLEYIVIEAGPQLGKYLDDVVDLSTIPELRHIQERLNGLRIAWMPEDHLRRILDRSASDNMTVALLSLAELKKFMVEQDAFIRSLASGDMFDPMIGQILAALVAAACRDTDGAEAMRLLAFECIGVLGAVDPDRCEISFSDPRMVVLSNFTDEGESVLFALHLIRDLLVGAFRSTSDLRYQGHLAYTIQELLKFCQFTPSLVGLGNGGSVPLKVRNRWNSLPKQVLETVTPLLDGRFTLNATSTLDLQHPIYPSQTTYREWIQLWTSHLITKASGPTARNIFSIFRLVVRNKDVVVAHHLLPHLVQNILISGHEDDAQAIRLELLAVLEDQVKPDSDSTADKKLLSAQAVFMLLDHLNKWVRVVRQDVGTKKVESKRSRANQIHSQAEEQLLRVDSILSSIDTNLMAKAAFQCKAYARSLMNFERQIVTLQERSPNNKDLPAYYERLHEIYSHLDEPDGMEGVSTLILSPSLEHQIRQHESTGRWTSAQSCWEVRLQQSPDNVEFHLGLLRCLRNLGHYDTLRTHVRGVLIRNPEWGSALAGFQVESAWMVGAWDDVQSIVERTDAQTSPIVIARLLLAMREGDSTAIAQSISVARSILGAPITAAGVKGYRRSYEAVLDLHLTHELEVIHNAITSLPPRSQSNSQQRRRQALVKLSHTLSARFDATLPTFRTREPVLSMRRTAFALSSVPRPALIGELGRSWLASAKIARKAGQWQTAYSAMLQAQQYKARFSFMESAKLVKVTGEPLRAVQELENSMRLLGLLDDKPDILDLTDDDDETKKMKAKAQVLRARWMNESERYDVNLIFKTYQNATELQPDWESCHFHLGQFHDECFKNLPPGDQANRGMRMNLYTVRSFTKAIRFGSKYVYQTVPRLLTIWLDLGEDPISAGTDIFKKLNDVVAKAIKDTPIYKWFTAFPQIVSRVGHSNPEVYKHLSRLIVKVMGEYPKQALWLFMSVIKSTKSNRGQRGKQILDQLRNNPHNAGTQVPSLIAQCVSMTDELLALCDYPIDDDSRKTLTMSKDFPKLKKLGRSRLIIPLQESLTASLPPTSSSESTHQPFPSNAPTFEEFADEIDIMRSLAKPRKITIRGSNGQIYMFLGKPKDDLRKDARLMDFNAIINKLLKANSESRRRQLHIRTYGVVTLNEECGFIQWVPNTIPIRPVLVKGYDSKGIRSWSGEMSDIFKRIKDAKDKDAGELYLQKIIPMFPPVFHEWFVETFPEPTAWLASRLSYGRTAAVMSMVGFILGLGDRHCENILLDSNTGDVVHVDFNCLFEKGKTLETPERVPFRLTQNMIDGLGVTRVEGVFRIACEVTMQLLRDNKDSLMSVLDAFIHDPLVEWEDEKRKLEREPSRRNQVKASVDLRMLAKHALNPIEKKLKGVYSTSKERQEKEISTSNLVQMLIQEATDSANLAKMYPGWAAWH